MQTTLAGAQNMANVDSASSPNWSTYNTPPSTLDVDRTTESVAGGKSSSLVAAPARVKPPAHW